MLPLFPSTARIDGSALTIGRVTAADLIAAHGSPLVVYDEATIRAAARAYREAAPDALIAYGTKAFPNLAILRLLAEEGIGADVSTLGEMRFAREAGIAGDRIVVHGNNKTDAELATAAREGALVVVDSLEEIERAETAGVTRTLVRFTPGIDADTHEAIRTAHHGSKFGLPAHDTIEALRRSPGIEGLHVHVGSQLLDLADALMAVDFIATFAAQARQATGWEWTTLDLGGGLGVATSPDEPELPIGEYVRAVRNELDRACGLHHLRRPNVIFEPGRSLVSHAGVTLYTVGSVKRVASATTYVAVDGGMSDNARPALYGARYTALLANRADETPTDVYAIAGKHCESGDVLIEQVSLPQPRRGDVLAVPSTGAYTLGMGSNYNVTPRPAAVLVADGVARVIRRRETLDDLLALEA
ncbi:MAG: diaminopimelate decarboxylase [Actinomycetes bacterium]